jgi:hypothetical protein
MSKRILIIGGVVGGATAAGYTLSVSVDAEIVMFEVVELVTSKQKI